MASHPITALHDKLAQFLRATTIYMTYDREKNIKATIFFWHCGFSENKTERERAQASVIHGLQNSATTQN